MAAGAAAAATASVDSTVKAVSELVAGIEGAIAAVPIQNVVVRALLQSLSAIAVDVTILKRTGAGLLMNKLRKMGASANAAVADAATSNATTSAPATASALAPDCVQTAERLLKLWKKATASAVAPTAAATATATAPTVHASHAVAVTYPATAAATAIVVSATSVPPTTTAPAPPPPAAVKRKATLISASVAPPPAAAAAAVRAAPPQSNKRAKPESDSKPRIVGKSMSVPIHFGTKATPPPAPAHNKPTTKSGASGSAGSAESEFALPPHTTARAAVAAVTDHQTRSAVQSLLKPRSVPTNHKKRTAAAAAAAATSDPNAVDEWGLPVHADADAPARPAPISIGSSAASGDTVEFDVLTSPVASNMTPDSPASSQIASPVTASSSSSSSSAAAAASAPAVVRSAAHSHAAGGGSTVHVPALQQLCVRYLAARVSEASVLIPALPAALAAQVLAAANLNFLDFQRFVALNPHYENDLAFDSLWRTEVYKRYPAVRSDSEKPRNLSWKQYYHRIGAEREAKIAAYSERSHAKMTGAIEARRESGAKLIDFEAAKQKLTKKSGAASHPFSSGAAGAGSGKPKSLFSQAAKSYSVERNQRRTVKTEIKTSLSRA